MACHTRVWRGGACLVAGGGAKAGCRCRRNKIDDLRRRASLRNSRIASWVTACVCLPYWLLRVCGVVCPLRYCVLPPINPRLAVSVEIAPVMRIGCGSRCGLLSMLLKCCRCNVIRSVKIIICKVGADGGGCSPLRPISRASGCYCFAITTNFTYL